MTKIRTRSTVQGLTALCVGALVLTSCGPDTSGDTTEAEELSLDDVEPAEQITFWTNHPGGSADTENELIEEFESETGISVEVVTSGANYEETSTLFQTSQGTGDVGDVVVLSDATWFPNYLNGSLIPVDEVLDQVDIDTSGYFEALFEDYLYDGDHYAVPYARSTPIFYYNKEHYEEAGLEDRAPETWEEAAEFSETLMDADVANSAFSFPPEPEYPGWTMANLVWGYGGSWSDGWDMSSVSSDETVEALEFAQAATGDWANVASGDQADPFVSGASSQVIQSTGSMNGILESADFEVGAGFLPGGPEEQEQTVPTGGAGLAIASDSDPEAQLAAAMFIGFMTSAESTAMFSGATGYLPVHQDADMGEVYEDTPLFETAVDQLERARVQDNARVYLPGGDLAIAQTLQNILTNDVDVAEQLEGLEDRLQELYEQDIDGEVEE